MTEQEYKEAIYKKADAVENENQLSKLVKEITEYNHTYGTIVYGCMAAMRAAFKVVNNSPKGGITGFQASCLGWECINKFMMIGTPARIVDYNNMLYPQYADKFDKNISPETWEHLKKEADLKLKNDSKNAHPSVLKHWQSVVDGTVPFGYEVKEQ